jgi:hypothetical protein
MEAEYIALSTALQALIPLRTIFAELNQLLSLLPPSASIIHSTVWEDNNSTHILANSNPVPALLYPLRNHLLSWPPSWEGVLCPMGYLTLLHMGINTKSGTTHSETSSLSHQREIRGSSEGAHNL